MKQILPMILLAGWIFQSAATAQTNATIPAVDATKLAASTAPTETPAPAVTPPPAEAAAPVVTPAPTAPPAPAPVVEPAANGHSAAPETTPGAKAAAPAGSIPLINFSDVPITTAIENLSRQAGINYMLDPKIGYGQPDASGAPKLEPQLSIRWENITPENALLALLDNYGLQLVHDKKTGIDRISPKDPLAPPPLITRVVQLKYASVSNMTEAVQSVFVDIKRSKVLPDVRSSQLIVVATEAEHVSVDTLIAQLDKPTRQVLIETRLVEVDSNPSSSKGVDWTGTLKAQNVSFGNGTLTGTSTTTTPGATTTSTTPGGGYSTSSSAGSSTISSMVTAVGNGGFNFNTLSGMMPEIGFLNADGLHAVLSFLNSSSDAQVVSTPRVVTLDNQMASIEVTRGYPVFNVSSSSANNSGGSSVNYSNVGTKLEVTPRISANDTIWLRVVPEVSSFFGNFSQTTGGGANGAAQVLTAPVFDRRTITTQVLIPNANTLVMGGLVKDNPRSDSTKVPLLGDIPLLGHAFRSENKSVDKVNLLIFITPTIVKDTDFHGSSSDFLKSRPDASRPQLINPDSKWDSSVKHNWAAPDKDSQK